MICAGETPPARCGSRVNFDVIMPSCLGRNAVFISPATLVRLHHTCPSDRRHFQGQARAITIFKNFSLC